MGLLDTLTMIVGVGIISYAGYVYYVSRQQQQQVAAAAPPPPTQQPIIQYIPQTTTPPTSSNSVIPPAAAAEPPQPQQEEKKPKQQPTTKPKTPAAAAAATALIPSTSEMTSPNVAGTSFTFNVVGDIDDNALAAATATNLCGDNPTLTLIIGDFAYHCDAQKWWTGSMKACNGKKNLGSVGNHDCSGKGYLELFPLNGGKWEMTYKVGNIAFIAVNTGFCSAVCMDLKSEALFQAAQADPSVKFIVAHFHKPIFTSGTAPDAKMELHTMMKKYPKVKMAFAGHNHKYIRFVPIEGIQYITAGRGGHDASGKEGITKGASSNTVGVVKCRVATDGSMTCQYVANSGEILDTWGLTAAGKHTGSGGVTPKQGIKASEAAYASSYLGANNGTYYDGDSADKEERDNAYLDMMFQQELRLHPRRKLNNSIYHYSARRY